MEPVVGLLETAVNRDAALEEVVEAGRDTDEGHLVVVDLAREADLAAEAPFDLAAHTDSKIVVAFVDFASLPNDCRPSCFQVREAAVQGLEEGFVRDHPIVDLAGRQSYQQADMLADEHPAEVVQSLGWEGRSLAAL
jgi:hypothetical protein